MRWHRTVRRRELAHLPAAAHDTLKAIESHVRPDFRRTFVFGGAALAALIAGSEIGGVHADVAAMRLVAYGCAALVVIFGVAASRTAAREVRRITIHRAGQVAAAPVRITILLTGYLIAAIACCDLLDIDVGRLLIGGAVTGIVLGLAAQPVLGNLFAGLVLLFARPYVTGERIRVLSGSINGPHEGVVISAGLLYTTLQTQDGPLNIPNSALLGAAVGPAVRPNGAGGDTGPRSAAVSNGGTDGGEQAGGPPVAAPDREAPDTASPATAVQPSAVCRHSGIDRRPTPRAVPR